MPEIIYEDNHLLIAVKKPGQLSQGDRTGDRSLLDELKDDVKARYHKPGEVYLGLVHRLDRPVGGLMAFARTSKAASRLSEQLRAHDMRREYLAVTDAGIAQTGEWHEWLCWDEERKRAVVAAPSSPKAQEAGLSFQTLGRKDGTALVWVRLQTGRKHQIRAQFANAGHPLLFDARYGQGEPGKDLALWGAALCLRHPTRREPMLFFSAPKGAAFAPYQDEIDRFFQDRREEHA